MELRDGQTVKAYFTDSTGFFFGIYKGGYLFDFDGSMFRDIPERMEPVNLYLDGQFIVLGLDGPRLNMDGEFVPRRKGEYLTPLDDEVPMVDERHFGNWVTNTDTGNFIHAVQRKVWDSWSSEM